MLLFSLNGNCKDNFYSKIVVASSCSCGPMSNGFGAMDRESFRYDNDNYDNNDAVHYRIMAMLQMALP